MGIRVLIREVKPEHIGGKPKPVLEPGQQSGIGNAVTCWIHRGSELMSNTPDSWSVCGKASSIISHVNLGKLIFISKPQLLHL